MTRALCALGRQWTVVLTAWALVVHLLSAGIAVPQAASPGGSPGVVLCLTSHSQQAPSGPASHGPLCATLCLVGLNLPAGPDPVRLVAPVLTETAVSYVATIEASHVGRPRSPALARAPPLPV